MGTKKVYIILFFLFLMLIFLKKRELPQLSSDSDKKIFDNKVTQLFEQGNGVSDTDGNQYPTIVINGQEWMQQNLAVTKYRNGAPIATGLDNAEWSSTTRGAYSIYDNDLANFELYGNLYNWYAVNDSIGVCPVGWHIPSDAEWSVLINYLDAKADGGRLPNTAGEVMKGKLGWGGRNTANNKSGFSARPSGNRNSEGILCHIEDSCYLWSSDENGYSHAFARVLVRSPSVKRQTFNKHSGFSVRCVRD